VSPADWNVIMTFYKKRTPKKATLIKSITNK